MSEFVCQRGSGTRHGSGQFTSHSGDDRSAALLGGLGGLAGVVLGTLGLGAIHHVRARGTQRPATLLVNDIAYNIELVFYFIS